MKATLKGKILTVERVGGDTRLAIEANGKVVTTNISAQEATLAGNIRIKSLIADQLKLGAILTIIISDEEPDERLT